MKKENNIQFVKFDKDDEISCFITYTLYKEVERGTIEILFKFDNDEVFLEKKYSIFENAKKNYEIMIKKRMDNDALTDCCLIS